jgi:hypothetical protein
MEKEDLILQMVNKLESRCDDLDRRMRRFETSGLAIAMLAVILGIGAGYGGIILKESKNELSTFQAKLALAQPAMDSLTLLQGEIQKLNEEVNPTGKKLDSQVSDGALLSRIKRFELTSPAGRYAWDGYFSDSSGLRDLAVEYVTLVAEDPEKTNSADLKDCFGELLKAANKVKERAKQGLRTDDKPDTYEMHWSTKQEDFKHLLSQVKEDDQAGVLTAGQLGCYQVAFPNWLANNGAFVNSPYQIQKATNSTDCLRRLKITE